MGGKESNSELLDEQNSWTNSSFLCGGVNSESGVWVIDTGRQDALQDIMFSENCDESLHIVWFHSCNILNITQHRDEEQISGCWGAGVDEGQRVRSSAEY